MKSSFYGVHPKDFKSPTCDIPIEKFPVNESDDFFISLSQHAGVPAKPIVEKGQSVKCGELIAEADGFISANIHSPVSGIVRDIATAPFPVYGTVKCIIITADGSQDAPQPVSDYKNLSDLAYKCGIVGMGGAMFPTNVKLSPKEPLHTLIINGIECEPFLTCDHRLMLERAEDLIKGALLIKDYLNLSKVVFGIESNKTNAGDKIRSLADGKVDVKVLPMIYPQGGEKQLILSVIGKEVPEGKLPSSLGVIVDNVSTVLALYDAHTKGTPVISRVVTVTGDVKSPKNLLVPIGTPLKRIIDYCGGSVNPIKKIIVGGPMTGFAVQSLDIPSYKGMNGVIISCDENNAIGVKKQAKACIRCGRCVRACPSGLVPVTLENLYTQKRFEDLYSWKVLNCIECGACNYACPSNRYLKTLFKLGKAHAIEISRKSTVNSK